MQKLIFINACIRKENSRTLRIAKPLLDELKRHYEITQIDLTDCSVMPVTAKLFHERGTSGISNEDIAWCTLVTNADRIVVAAPFWDMSFPSVLKAFFEHVSVPDITFKNNEDGTTRGNCKAQKMLYITTRGMNIQNDSPLDQGSSYLRALSWLWGIEELHTVAACGMDVNDSETVERLLQEAIHAGLSICKEF